MLVIVLMIHLLICSIAILYRAISEDQYNTGCVSSKIINLHVNLYSAIEVNSKRYYFQILTSASPGDKLVLPDGLILSRFSTD